MKKDRNSSKSCTGIRFFKCPVTRLLVLILLFVLLSGKNNSISGQSAGDYRTRNTGNWSNYETWQKFNGSTWENCTGGWWGGDYPGASAGAGTVTIRPTHTVTVTDSPPNPVGSLVVQSNLTYDDTYTINVSGDFTISGGTLNMSTSNGKTGTLNIGGNFLMSGGSITETSNRRGRIRFNKSGIQTFIKTGGTISNNIRFIVNSGSNLDMGTYILDGSTESFTLNSGATLTTANSEGISSSPALSGSIQVTGTRSFSTGANYVYNGTAAQISGSGLPATVNSLTVNNPAGVTLTGNTTVSNTLTMTQGNIIPGTNKLILSGNNLSYTAGTITGKFQRAITSTGLQYLYPVGTGSGHNPLKITFSNLTPGQLAVQFMPDDIGNTGLPLDDSGTEITNTDPTGYWTLTATGSLASTAYDVNLDYTGFTGFDTSDRILKRNNGGNLTLDGSHGSVTPPEITRTGMSGISTITTDLAVGKAGPKIITQPSDATGCNSSFTVMATGTAPLTYQWQEDQGSGFTDIADGGVYSGTSTSTLVITVAPMTMNGYRYRCIVTDGNSRSTTSESALLTVTVVTFGYSYSTEITLDPASGPADLTDFPALISISASPDRDRLRTVANGGRVTSNNGYDIVFTDQNGSALDHQIEDYDPVTGQYIAWVRIPVLSNTSSTTIKMLYGNAAATSDPSVRSVWTSNYKGVWHLNGADYTDATINGNDGTPNATVNVAGRIAGGKDFNGSTSYIITPTNGMASNDNNQTISIWGYYTATPSNARNLITFQNADSSSAIQLGFRDGNTVAWKWGGVELVNGGAAPSINTWHYYTYTFDGTTSRLYVDGIEKASSTVAPQTAMPDECNIGRYNDGEYIDAVLDEPRFSMSYKSAGWILTEYNNQNDPSGFISLGAETGNDLLARVGACSADFTLNQGYPAGGTYSGTGVSGTNFNASSAGIGTHEISYSYTDIYGCTNIVEKDIIVTAVPSAPVAADRECCYLNIADLEATGTNLKWYFDAGLTQLEGTGNPFPTGKTNSDTYTYYVTQTIDGCESLATTVSLTINRGITIDTQPQPATACLGSNASFSVAATGYNLSYQWQEDGADISDGGIYSGATTSTLTLTDPGMTKDGKVYGCIISTSCGPSPVVSSTAALTVVTDFVWTGTISNDWNDPANWICTSVPDAGNTVRITNVANKPVLASGIPAAVNNLTIEAGSSLTIVGNTIQLAGTITNNGTFNLTDGTIEFTGTSAQIIAADLFENNTIKDLIINNSAGVTLQGPLNISGIVTLQNGNLTSDGFLTLLSTASETALIDGIGSGSISGNVTMQRYLPSGFGYKYFSSPFQSATVAEFSDDMDLGTTFSMFWRYDENRISSGWVAYNTPSDILNPLHGYAANFGAGSDPNTMDITGEVNNGPLAVTLYNNNQPYTKGFNLVGNPYPSPIDWDAASGWTKTSIDDALYYFKAGTTDQYGGTYSTYIGTVSSDGLATNIIPSMQGFFVHVSDGIFPVEANLALDNSVRVTDLTHSFLKSGKSETKPLLRLRARFSDDPGSADPAVIYFDEKAATTFDSGLDALKLMNTDLSVPNLYSTGNDGKRLSINGLPLDQMTECIVPLGIKTGRNGTLVFSITDLDSQFSGTQIYMNDAAAGTNHDLLDGKEYNILLPAGEYDNRFYLNITSTPTDIYNVASVEDLLRVYYSKGILKVFVTLNTEDGILSLTNLTGQTVFMDDIYESGYHEFNTGLKSGIYLVTLTTKHRRISRKVFIYD